MAAGPPSRVASRSAFLAASSSRSLFKPSFSARSSSPPPFDPITQWYSRVLFPPSHPLPPAPLLESSALHLVSQELYTWLALIAREFILPWYGKFTKDREFLAAIAHVVGHFLRGVEKRLGSEEGQLALRRLIVLELPTIVRQHYEDYRLADSKFGSTSVGGVARVEELFHALQPHVAVSADGQIDDAYLRAAVERVMQENLPPEDWKAETERFIIREIVVRVVLRNIFVKVPQPWMIHNLLLKALEPVQSRSYSPSSSSTSLVDQALKTFGHLFLALSMMVSVLAPRVVRYFSSLLGSNNKAPGRDSDASSDGAPQAGEGKMPTSDDVMSPFDLPPGTSSLGPSLRMVEVILTTQNRATSRQVIGLAAMAAGAAGRNLDMFLATTLSRTLLNNPFRLAKLLSQARASLFPGGHLALTLPDPSPAEQFQIRQRLEQRLLDVVPPFVRRLVLGPDNETALITISAALDPVSSYACNTRLALKVVERVLVVMCPTLEASPESMEEGEGASEGLRTAM